VISNLAYLRRTFGEAARRVVRLYNGLHLERFAFRSPEARAPCIVAVGRLIEKKGFAELISACERLAKRGVSLTCEILGAGELEAALRAQIGELGLDGRVHLLGPRPQNEVLEHVRSAAVFAAPCVVGADGNADGLPTVLLEAMALGTPCVSTDVTGIPEVLRDGETGLQVKPHDPAGLAAAIERLFMDADLRISLANRARQLIEREFDACQNAAQQWEWFAEAINESGFAPLDRCATSSRNFPEDSTVSPLVAARVPPCEIKP
jgi:glycosyltransferase involved in cell wall biosynthesis